MSFTISVRYTSLSYSNITSCTGKLTHDISVEMFMLDLLKYTTEIDSKHTQEFLLLINDLQGNHILKLAIKKFCPPLKVFVNTH